jgi:hypothetical protein
MSKEQRFNKVLQKCKEALDSIKIKFHLHFGTALGAHREKSFIKHDNDIDVAIFHKDVNTTSQVRKIQKAMEEHGFVLSSKLGNINDTFEMQFEMNDIGLDIFWIKEGSYRGKKYYIYSSYYGMCDELPKKKCIWGMRPYKTEKVNFLGKEYRVIPKKTLEDLYGKDWTTPKIYDYYEGLAGAFKGLIPDYYKPRPTNNKVAFCFLLYDTHKHSNLWTKFFSGDNYPVKNYSIYTHLKTVSDKTPQWVYDHRIRNIKTGWCEENLVMAWIKLLQEALKNKDNKYFALLSGECIPLYNFVKTYKKITSSKKSRVHIDYNAESYVNSGLLYADQWVTLTREDAKMLVKLKTSEEGKKFRKEMRKMMCEDSYCYCPDEIFPIGWFVKKYGKPSSEIFKKHIRIITSTYTYWDGKKPHPVKFNSKTLKKKKKEMCKSGALFARKFNSKAGREIAMSCK